MATTLYDTDFVLWTEEQAEALRRARDRRTNRDVANLNVDWDNLIEEIEDLGRSDLAAFESQLRNVLIHLLKLEWSPDVQPRRHWRREVLAFRQAGARRLRQSPSLRTRSDLQTLYEEARESAVLVIDDAAFASDTLPTACLFTLDQLLDRDWWPENRFGLE